MLNHGASRSSSRCGSRPPPTSPTCSRSRTRSRRRASTTSAVEDGRLVLGYRRERLRPRDLDHRERAARRSSTSAASRFRIRLEPHARVDDLPRRRHRRRTALGRSASGAKYGHGDDAARPNMQPQPRRVARRRRRELVLRLAARSSGSTSAAWSTWPRSASTRRSLPGHGAARRRPALVHDGLRARQPDHELPGAAVRARARRDDAARARRAAGRRRSTTSATRSRARSSTRSASAS